MNCPGCQNLVDQKSTFCGTCGLSLATHKADMPTVQSGRPLKDAPPADPLVGQVLDSKYELLELLGQEEWAPFIVPGAGISATK